ncbi:MAG: lipocalin family protein [Bacteroidales bacterium]|nr:lipocalin family protein [Bacteroidales bacterium]
MKKILLMGLLFTVGSIYSCSNVPKGVVVVRFFEIEKFLGTWYEIAQLEAKYEKKSSNISVNYSLNEDGTIRVMSQGYNVENKEWMKKEGKATFYINKNIAMLEISYGGLFHTPYNVIALDEAYTYALVIGKNTHYLWLLSRKKTIPEEVKQVYLKMAKDLGCKTSDLVWVEHD